LSGGIATGSAADGPDVRNADRAAVHLWINRSAFSVRDMATANPLWGAPRIHGELRTLGVDVSERTVSRLLGRCPRPSSQTWKTFLTNHLASAASMDFFTVPTLTGRVLFVLIVLARTTGRCAPHLLWT
jgi:hypothetical protein